jgi:hypothetical protein
MHPVPSVSEGAVLPNNEGVAPNERDGDAFPLVCIDVGSVSSLPTFRHDQMDLSGLILTRTLDCLDDALLFRWLDDGGRDLPPLDSAEPRICQL